MDDRGPALRDPAVHPLLQRSLTAAEPAAARVCCRQETGRGAGFDCSVPALWLRTDQLVDLSCKMCWSWIWRASHGLPGAQRAPATDPRSSTGSSESSVLLPSAHREPVHFRCIAIMLRLCQPGSHDFCSVERRRAKPRTRGVAHRCS